MEIDRKTKVALVTCASYRQEEVDAALAKAIRLLGGLEGIFAEANGSSTQCGTGGIIDKDSRLLLKPNLLARTSPEKACTTHPAVFRAAGKLLQEAGYRNLVYGDSPGNPMMKPEKIAEGCGLKEEADKLGIPFGRFEHGTQVEFPEGKACREFILCDEIPEVDGVINLCKMKTHQLERITGAVKNTFGCVYGINKGASHAKFTTAANFADMLADLNRLVSPKLHIMDGIVAMEGNGPQSGTPKAMNVIMASADPVAVDAVFCHLVHLDPKLVPTNVSAMKRGVGTYEEEAITVLTEEGCMTPAEAAARYGTADFDVQRGADFQGNLVAIGIMAPFVSRKPVIRRSQCVGCGICVESCPLPEKAIGFPGGSGSAGGSGNVPVYDYGRCIKCWCCQEMCPKEAIVVKTPLLLRAAQRMGIV